MCRRCFIPSREHESSVMRLRQEGGWTLSVFHSVIAAGAVPLYLSMT